LRLGSDFLRIIRFPRPMWKARWSWYRMTHCHFARWKTLVVVPYDIFPCEIHWLCYRMAHWHVALVVVPYGALSCCTGCGTVWHIARLKALVVVLHSILPGERHWLWYRIRHCQVKYTGRVTTWHNARLKALVVIPYDTLPCARHWSWYRMTHFNTWPRWERIQNLHKFRNYKSIRQHLYASVSIWNARLLTSMWLIIRLG
jgi:hypothetical protein